MSANSNQFLCLALAALLALASPGCRDGAGNSNNTNGNSSNTPAAGGGGGSGGGTGTQPPVAARPKRCSAAIDRAAPPQPCDCPEDFRGETRVWEDCVGPCKEECPLAAGPKTLPCDDLDMPIEDPTKGPRRTCTVVLKDVTRCD